MCYLQPLKVTKIKGGKVSLDNGIEALCDTAIRDLKVGDEVLVYGNLIISKIDPHHVKTN